MRERGRMRANRCLPRVVNDKSYIARMLSTLVTLTTPRAALFLDVATSGCHNALNE